MRCLSVAAEVRSCYVQRWCESYLLHESFSERTQADGDQCSVVENHSLRVYFVDVVLDVRHQQLVSSNVIAIVEGVVVDRAEKGASATAVVTVLEDKLAQFLQLCSGIVNWWGYCWVAQECSRVHYTGVQLCLSLAHDGSRFAYVQSSW